MKLRAMILAGAVLLATSSLALGNGLYRTGSGARAMAMGGAFVGLADDISALAWNPAGLGFVKGPLLGFSFSDLIPAGSYVLKFDLPDPIGRQDLADATTRTMHYLGGLAGYVRPVGPALVAGIGIYMPAGQGTSWDPAGLTALSNGREDIDWSSRATLFTIAPTLAYRIGGSLSLGVQLNLNYGVLDLNSYAGQLSLMPEAVLDLGQYEEHLTGWGVGATIGVLFKPGEKVGLGLVYRTASRTKLTGSARLSALSYLGYPDSSAMDRRLTWPAQVAAGLAVRPLAGLTITADLQFTDWTTMDIIGTSFEESAWSDLMARTGRTTMPLHWEGRVQGRIGAEYLVRKDLALRAGYYHDPAPGPDRTMNILLPTFDRNGLTFGGGYALDGLQVDFGLEVLFGTERNLDVLKFVTDPAWASAQPGRYDMTILVPHFQVGYRF